MTNVNDERVNKYGGVGVDSTLSRSKGCEGKCANAGKNTGN